MPSKGACPALLFSCLIALSVNADQRAIVTTIAGVAAVAGFQDGSAQTATFNEPTWLDVVTTSEPYHSDVTLGDIFVTDRLNSAIRRISGQTVSTEIVRRNYYDAGSEPIRFDFQPAPGGGIVLETGASGCGGGPWDRGMWVANSGAHQVVLLAPLSLTISLANRDEGSPIVGAADAVCSAGGYTGEACFHTPTGLARSWLYSWQETTRQALFIADTGNHTIRVVRFGYGAEGCPIPSSVGALAGRAGQSGSVDGVGAAARFDAPSGIAAAPDGSVYVADTGNHTIRRVATDGTVTTVAGQAGVPGSNDGPARQAHLNLPSGIDVSSSGEVFIADTGNSIIRELTLDGRLITIAGTPGLAGFADGEGTQAKFNRPVGVRVLAGDTLIVADTRNHAIRRITLSSAESTPRRRSARH